MEKIVRKYQLKRGLVLGKFAPLHIGHQYLIETALQKCDELYVVIYNCPETISIPLNIRADWIRHLYPQVTVIEAWDGPSESGRSRRIKSLQENYLKRILPSPITHFFSSEWYGAHVSKALGAIDVRVDMNRNNYPISATLVRSDPHKFRSFLNYYVYKDFVEKIVLLGAESTGKSTLSRYVAKKLATTFTPEYGRYYWTKYHDEKGKLTPDQLNDLALRHLQSEIKHRKKANKYLIVDTNAHTTLMFHQYYHDKTNPKLESLVRKVQDKYKYWFVCDTDIPYVNDGSRSGEYHRKVFQQKIIADLEKRGINYQILSGSLEQRFEKLKQFVSINKRVYSNKTTFSSLGYNQSCDNTTID